MSSEAVLNYLLDGLHPQGCSWLHSGFQLFQHQNTRTVFFSAAAGPNCGIWPDVYLNESPQHQSVSSWPPSLVIKDHMWNLEAERETQKNPVRVGEECAVKREMEEDV